MLSGLRRKRRGGIGRAVSGVAEADKMEEVEGEAREAAELSATFIEKSSWAWWLCVLILDIPQAVQTRLNFIRLLTFLSLFRDSNSIY